MNSKKCIKNCGRTPDYACDCKGYAQNFCRPCADQHWNQPGSHKFRFIVSPPEQNKFTSLIQQIKYSEGQIIKESQQRIQEINKQTKESLQILSSLTSELREKYSNRIIIDDAFIIDLGGRLKDTLTNFYSEVFKYVLKEETKPDFIHKLEEGTYTGTLINKQPDGIGVMMYSKGECYDGQYIKGKKSGQGIYFYENGDIYKGEWKDDLKHGNGIFIGIDHEYQGNWVNDTKSGHGICKYNSGNSYQGSWFNNFKHGAGIEHIQGQRFEGTWKEGKKHGMFFHYFKDGSENDEFWFEDIKLQSDDEGKKFYEDGQEKKYVEDEELDPRFLINLE